MPRVKPSDALAWTKKQRAALVGTRVRHRFDPAPKDRAAEAWERIRGWFEAAIADRLPSARFLYWT